MIRALPDDGVVRVGPHGLGLDINAEAQLIGADWAAHPRLWVVGPLRRGPLRRGQLRETTAVPEIRAQAHRLVTDLSTTATTTAVAVAPAHDVFAAVAHPPAA